MTKRLFGGLSVPLGDRGVHAFVGASASVRARGGGVGTTFLIVVLSLYVGLFENATIGWALFALYVALIILGAAFRGYRGAGR